MNKKRRKENAFTDYRRTETTTLEWVRVARIFHHDWLRYGEHQSRTARDQALANARHARPPEAVMKSAKRLAEFTGRDWRDCGSYERQTFIDLAQLRRSDRYAQG